MLQVPHGDELVSDELVFYRKFEKEFLVKVDKGVVVKVRVKNNKLRLANGLQGLLQGYYFGGTQFAVKRKHLIKRMTVEQIETRERIQDPLNAVPDLPFGHLNTAWHEFLKYCAQGSEIWSFRAPGRLQRWRRDWRSGYALVQDGVPMQYFLTILKE